MRRLLSFFLTGVLIIGLLTACSGNSDKDGVTPTPADKVTIPTETPTEAPSVTPDSSVELTPSAEPTGEPDSKPDDVTVTGTVENPENPDSADDNSDRNSELWKNTSEMFLKFINNQEYAEGMEGLCEYFSEEERYTLKDIVCGCAQYIYDTTGGVDLSLTDISYSLINSATKNKPNLVIEMVYESDYDSPHYEKLVFGDNNGVVRFITNLSTYYRGEADLNNRGYYWYVGSSGFNVISAAYYYIDSNNMGRFVYAVDEVTGCAELKIPNSFLPYDADSLVLNESESEYSENGYSLEIFCLEQYNEAEYLQYSDYQRSAYYTFSDSESNPVMPDSEYIEACRNEGIRIVSKDEIEKIISERKAELGITEDVVNAPTVTDMKELNVEDYFDDSLIITEEPVEYDEEVIDGYMSFLEGNIKATSLGMLCNKFSENGQYKLKKIVSTYEKYLEESYSVELDFTDMSYAFVENEIKGKPYMVLQITYETPDRMDAPHIERMLFDYDGYCCNFIANYECYYRTYANIWKKGLVTLYGSISAFENYTDFYYIDSYEDKYNLERFLFNISSIFGLAETQIPAFALPTDSKVAEENQINSSDGNYVLLRYSFRPLAEDSDENWYNSCLRECYYIFYDEDDNVIIPDEEYIRKCAEDGIRIVSEEELTEKMQAVYDEYGVTEENLWASELEDDEFTHYDFE